MLFRRIRRRRRLPGEHRSERERAIRHSERSNQTQKEIPVEPTEAANDPSTQTAEEVLHLGGPSDRSWVIIPTYNESENIKPASSAGPVARCRTRTSSSPTTTHLTARASWPTRSRAPTTTSMSCTDLAKKASVRRTSRAFEWGLNAGYEVLVEMDADGSHQPEQLPRLLGRPRRRRPGAGIALGQGRQGAELAQVREVLSRGGTSGLSRYSASRWGRTGGYRVFRRKTLRGSRIGQCRLRGATASRSTWPGEH